MSDIEDYITEHMELFGHRPVPNLATGYGCVHPMHDTIRQIISAPGVKLEIDFSYADMLSDDDPVMQDNKASYDRAVANLRDKFKAIEEEDAAKDEPKKLY